MVSVRKKSTRTPYQNLHQMVPSKYTTYHNQINRYILLIGFIRTEALIEQVLSTRRKSGGQGRKRKLSDPEDHGDSDEQWWKAPEKRLRPNINNSEKNREMEDPEAE